MGVDSIKMRREIEMQLARIHRLVDSLCGLYTRVAKRLKVDRSYVSRVARGERRSSQVEKALLSEFQRISAKEQL